MNIFKWMCSIFKKKKKDKSIDTHYTKKPKGQELIYWNNYLNRKNLTKVLIPLVSLFIFSLILIISIKPVTEDQIYTENFKYDVYGITRGSTYDSIIHSLATNNHQESFRLLEKAIQKDSTQNMYIFYYSLVAMQLNKHDIAQKYLKKLHNGNNLFDDDSQWFLALSYLKTNKEKAIEEFREISKNKYHYKQDVAKKILRKIE